MLHHCVHDWNQEIEAIATGQVQLSVPGCLVRHKRVFPKEATHFRIRSCIGTVNFDKKRCSYHIAAGALLPLGKQMADLQLEHQLTGKPGEVMLHTAGIIFFKGERLLKEIQVPKSTPHCRIVATMWDDRVYNYLLMAEDLNGRSIAQRQ